MEAENTPVILLIISIQGLYCFAISFLSYDDTLINESDFFP